MENNGLSDNGGGRARILIVGAGFAGFACAREREKRHGLDWILDAVLPRPLVRLGIGKEEDAPLAAAERTGIYEDLGQRLTRG